MASTHENPTRDQMVGGINRGGRPHLIGNDWRTTYGMRFDRTMVRQVPRKRVAYRVAPFRGEPVLHLEALPGSRGYSTFVALTSKGVWRLRGAAESVLLDQEVDFQVAGRWGTCRHNHRLFFTNLETPVLTTDGAQVKVIGADVPGARYVEIFYDRVVLGWTKWKGIETPSRFRWSHLYDYSDWKPKPHNEADYFDCVEHQEGIRQGITGLKRFGPVLLIYTPSAIYASRYTGLGRGVMVTDCVSPGIGCGLPYGLAAAEGMHFFPDLNAKTFFMYTHDGPKEIGQKIRDLFFEDLNTNALDEAFAYVDRRYREVHWVYPSYPNTVPDREVVFNWTTGAWWWGPVEGVRAFCEGGRVARSLDEQTGVNSALVGINDEQGNTEVELSPLYGMRDGVIAREAVEADLTQDCLEQEIPHLETGDYVYESVQEFKEVRSTTIHSTYRDAAGVLMEHATRDYLDGQVIFQVSGLWTPSVKSKRLGQPEAAGRVFRYRFMPVPLNDSVEVTYPLPGTSIDTLVEIYRIGMEPPPPVPFDPWVPEEPGAFFGFEPMGVVILDGQQEPEGLQALVPLKVSASIVGLGSGWWLPHIYSFQVDDPLGAFMNLLGVTGTTDLIQYLNEVLNSEAIPKDPPLRLAGRLWTHLNGLGPPPFPAGATFVRLLGIRLSPYDPLGGGTIAWSYLTDPPEHVDLYDLEESAEGAQGGGTGYVMDLLVEYLQP